MTQKIIKVGSSAAVTIPKAALKALGLSIGDTVDSRINKKKSEFIIEPSVKVRPEVVEWTNDFIDENRSLLERLADS